jgi:Spy/CpxP family protein refolding chaperone
MSFVVVLVAFLVGFATPTFAGPPPGMGGPEVLGAPGPPGPPGFLAQLFPPKLVMEHQQEIDLRADQAEGIREAMKTAQQTLVDLQWRLDAESEKLGKLLAAAHVDEAAVIAKLDEVTEIERQVKKVNFTLLVRVKNQLDPQQQAKLRELRPAPRPGPPGAPPRPE